MYIAVIVSLFQLISADILLTTQSGPIRGVSSRYEENVDAFLGIPYAEPPVGPLRFNKPIQKKNWKDTLNATKFHSPCAQYTLAEEPYFFIPDLTNMSEDCLYLNVWVPKSKSDTGLRPIIIYIHGGGFSTGSATSFDGSKFASRGDLIFATINYRVGALGYFLAHIKEAPGNMGMYDQIMAIKWIKDNAKVFGGDPENIVLMGESVGAFSITAHMVSPLSKHLFKRAIMQSGSLINAVFNDENARLIKNSQSLASTVGCINETVNLQNEPHAVVSCLKQKPKEEIIEAEKLISKTSPLTFFPALYDEFLPKSAVELYHEGKFGKEVDVLIGFNRDEGTLFMVLLIPDYFGNYGRNNVRTMTKKLAVFFSQANLRFIGQSKSSEIIDFYLSRVKDQSSQEYIKMIADGVGDNFVTCPTIFQAEFLSLKGNSVYLYQFEFRPVSTPMEEWVGVTHEDELQYVFGIPSFDNFTSEEVEFSNSMLDRWSTFARTGNPNIPGHIPWPRYSYHNQVYLNFGQEEETIRINPLKHRCDIWRTRFNADINETTIRHLRNSGDEQTPEPYNF